MINTSERIENYKLYFKEIGIKFKKMKRKQKIKYLNDTIK